MLPTRTGFRMLSVASQPVLRAIGRVVGSDALADAAAFFQAFAGMEAGFRERAEADGVAPARRLDPFVLVTSPRRETIDEAGWFADQLVTLGFGVAAVVVNRVHPAFGEISVADARPRRPVPPMPGGTTSPRCGRTWRRCGPSQAPSGPP